MESAWIIVVIVIIALYVVYREFSMRTRYMQSAMEARAQQGPTGSDAELVRGFVKTIIPHHQVAIERALSAYKFSHNQNLKWEARRIVLGQDYNVWTLWNFFHPIYRAQWAEDGEFARLFQSISETHNRVLAMQLEESARNNPYFPTKVPLTESERRFVEDMIDYHQQTIAICEDFESRVSYGSGDSEHVNMILALCYDIKRQQTLEIGQLRDFIGA
jgi:uncharacterized protein (DUF305 family)